ncbi:MAG: glutamine-hydrolyzing GMP synthase [Alphaproteobacteria bacterium]|nr:glutamine-hydrolyzing GMP synthase [Alphaproteobacteria bacterium]MCL2504648.1 glutamine-hydrolyzing GMP synthase [Alphaproteobacteria bacterium]
MLNSQNQDKILILDFGSQVTQLIARRVREAGVYCEIHPFMMPEQKIKEFNPKGIILSGGPASTTEEHSPRAAGIVFELGVPVLGICYGQQTMSMQLGGRVEVSDNGEYGKTHIKIKKMSKLFKGVWDKDETPQVWMSHRDKVTEMPEGFEVYAVTETAPFAIIADEDRNFYGVQFHPEVYHTIGGAELLKRFVLDVCGCAGDWNMQVFMQIAEEKIKAQIGKGKVICGLSGGVDSMVTALLIHKAIGNQLSCIFVDTGLMRANEGEEVISLFTKHCKIPLIAIDASERFLKALDGVTDPEEKRKTIGKLFIEVFEEQAKQISGAEFLAQGTLYPDVIESVSVIGGPSATIKSHHNVGGLPAKMNLKLVEPVRELFKDEVRELGRELGLPEIFVGRHPFPGPGLGIRVIGEITRDKLEVLRKADSIYLEEIREAGLYDKIWQAFAVLLPIRTVGVMGDGRTYDNVLALRAVTSTDGMTAESYPFEHEFIAKTASRIINEVKGVNRVVYDITSKPPGTIEWE